MNNEKPLLLLVDDDEIFCSVMAQALDKRGFQTLVSYGVKQAIERCQTIRPEYAVIDLNMPNESGLTLVKYLAEQDATIRIIILTGYASIATTVEAIKLGATYYLAKPANADDIVAAFKKTKGNAAAEIEEQNRSLNQIEWEHIQQTLIENEGNVSATARALGMHRRTLQRKLQKRPG